EDYTEAGMPDQLVLTVTFQHVIGRDPTPREIAALMAKYLEHLPQTVAASQHHVVFPGVTELLTRLCDSSHLLGLSTGNVEAASPGGTASAPSAATARIRRIAAS